jgi:HEAT repeat protein
VLREFSACGEFGQNTEFAGSRMPGFRDYAGRRCAVAELMHASGEDEFVESVRFTANHGWICDFQGMPIFEGWLDRVGLSIDDAARIQAPMTGSGSWGQPPPQGAPSDGVPSGETGGRGRGNTGPGDTVPGGSGPTRPASGGSSPTAPSSPRTPGAGSAPTAGRATAPNNPATPTPVSLATTSDDTWWLWWEYNKLAYLLPNRLNLQNMPSTGDDAGAAFRTAIEQARKSTLPLFEQRLQDDDASVRASAAMALGRVGRGASIEKLFAMLDDANVEVRHRAILALGSTGSPEAVLPLLSIARHGALDETKSSISPVAKPLAIVALGLGRRLGFDARIDIEIAKLIQERAKSEREEIGVAALVYQMLAPCKELERYALSMAKDQTEAPSVRCRAIESMRTATDNATLSELQHFLSGPRLDMRRSAALALGDFENPLALPGLIVAYELEAEPLTRGFILTSIGKQGGAKSQAYLMKVLEKGENGMRRWAALALGLQAREMRDSLDVDAAYAIARAIREATPRENNAGAMGAYWIASGLARDEQSRTTLRNALSGAGDARQRMYAASALALLEGDASAEVLRQRIKLENQSVVRVAIAQSLGILGRGGDVPAMLDMLMRLNEPGLQAVAASALSTHGSPEALQALKELASVESGSSVRRAAVIDGLGMMLGGTAPFVLSHVSRNANYTVFSEWVGDMFQTTL